jgi:uncharacterized protein (TIGR02246 family)
MTEDERAIRQVVATWLKASADGDVEAVLDLMTDDVIFMVAGQEPFGNEAYRAAAEASKHIRLEGKSDIREITVLGDVAYMRNHLDVSIPLPGGKVARRAGYTLTVLRKQADGRWLVARDANLMTQQPPQA